MALVDGARRWSFAEFAAEVEALTSALAASGARVGSVVSAQLPNWWETAALFWATFRLGATLNPILPIFRRRELGFILKEARSELLFVPGVYRGFDHRALAAELASDAPSLREVVVVRHETERPLTSWREFRSRRGATPRPPSAADVALLMYTSGTTADPKGVLHSHDALLYETRSLVGAHALGSSDVVLMPSPLTHVSGLNHAALAPFLLGTRAILAESWNPEAALATIAAEQVTYMVGAPVFLADLLREPRFDALALASFRLFSCGGAGVPVDLLREATARIGCVAKRVYGSTEMPTLTTSMPDDPLELAVTTEGRPIGAAELRIVDDAERDLPAGSEGEILCRGPELFLGYRDDRLDAPAFTADGWFRTGDLGVVRDDGALVVTGRKKDVVIRKGEKISAAEVEAAIERHPAIHAAAIVALPDPATGERACA
ncbi:MAG: AMP-binding protein, partial [Candidatus Binatia bacterium]